MQQPLTTQPVTLRQFIFVYHRKMLGFTGFWMAVVFVAYKIIYPFPDFYVDSYHYIGMAANSNFMSTWPIGYSWFLRAVHWVSPHHYFLVVVQYLLLQLSSLWLAFTLFYYLQAPQWVKQTVLVFLVVNPLYLYMANLVSSDVLFTALSLVWLTILLQMVFNAQFWQVLFQGPLLAYLFLVRYQAAFYPVIMLAALWMAEFRIGWKIISAAIFAVLLVWIVRVTIATNKKWYGTDQFYGQGGWISANNALYLYNHVHIDTAAFRNTPLAPLNQYVDSFFRARGLMAHNYTPWDGPRFMLANEVMWNHLATEMRKAPGKPTFWYYNRMGVPWAQFGKHLITHHPLAHARYFLLPNIGLYFWPVMEQFDVYNMGGTTIPAQVAKWFHLPGTTVVSYWPYGSLYLMGMFRALGVVLHVYLLVSFIVIVRKKKYLLLAPFQRRLLLLMLMAFVGNMGLLMVAAPVMLRYTALGWIWAFLLLVLLLPLVFYKVPVPETSPAVNT